MSAMKLPARILMVACCIAAVPTSAELRLDLVEGGEAISLDAKMRTSVKVRAGGGQGGTAMHWMAFNGDAAGIRELIISGAEVNGRVKTGATPLHLAAFNGHTEAARVLIEHGAKVNARTKAGITPWDWAQKNGHEEVAKLLIAHGAKATRDKPARPSGPAAGSHQTALREPPAPAVVQRPSAPLKFSLMQLPEESVVVRNGLETGAEQLEKPVSVDAYRIQLGAFGSEQRAVDAWSLYRKKYPELLGTQKLILDKASVKGKSYHRVQAGPMSRSDAWTICGQLKQVGQSCAVMKRGLP